MRAIKPALAGTMSVALMVGSVAAVVAQDEADAQDPYLAGMLTGTLAPDYGNPYGCGPIMLPDGTEMPPVTMIGTTMGMTTLLGETTMTSMNCYSPGDVMANIPEATFTLTGVGGDALSGTWSGDCAPSFVTQPTDTYLCHGLLLVTEGTGAFEGASGQIAMMSEHWYAGVGEAGENPMPTGVRLEGLIEYPAAAAE